MDISGVFEMKLETTISIVFALVALVISICSYLETRRGRLVSEWAELYKIRRQMIDKCANSKDLYKSLYVRFGQLASNEMLTEYKSKASEISELAKRKHDRFQQQESRLRKSNLGAQGLERLILADLALPKTDHAYLANLNAEFAKLEQSLKEKGFFSKKPSKEALDDAIAQIQLWHAKFIDEFSSDGDWMPSDCPHGHGPLKEWEGKMRCWTCGWPEI